MSDESFEAFQKTTIAYKAAGEEGYYSGISRDAQRGCFLRRSDMIDVCQSGFAREWQSATEDITPRVMYMVNDTEGFEAMCSLADQIILNQHAIRAHEHELAGAHAFA